MKIGGKLYLADMQRQKRFAYSRRLNRHLIQAQQQAVRFYGEALFHAQIVQGRETTRLALQQVVGRLAGNLQSRLASLSTVTTGVSAPPHGADRRIDRRV